MVEIKDKIITVRGVQVILDRDLAQLYGVETKRLNEQVKRNKERFPEDFMFQLTVDEYSRSQFATLNTRQGKNQKYMPYAFTENGVAMLSSVLRSETAIAINIRIMRTFTMMKKTVSKDTDIYHRLELVEYGQLEIRKQVNESVAILDHLIENLNLENYKFTQRVFFDGQIYDAYAFMADLVRSATRRIILIDNYIDDTVLTLLDKRTSHVKAIVYTGSVSKQLRLDLAKHNAQYPPIDIRIFTKSHDRFLIIDDDVYLIGASIKDLGKKWFGFTLMENTDAEELLQRL